MTPQACPAWRPPYKTGSRTFLGCQPGAPAHPLPGPHGPLPRKYGILHYSLSFPPRFPQEACFNDYNTNGLRGLQLRHGPGCPPGSTIRSWGQRLRDAGQLQPIKRPKSLTGPEEEAVATAVTNLRAAGAVVDSEVLISLGRSAAGEARGAEVDLPELGRNWAQGFRRRWRFSKLRKSSTDRPPLTEERVLAVNVWRA